MEKKRKYFAEDFEITTWESLEAELKKLLEIEIVSSEGLIEFWERVSELVKIVEDKAGWLYITMTRFADKSEHRDALNKFMSEIVAKNEPYQFELKKKFYNSPFRSELPQQYKHLSKIIANEIEMFREENVPLFVKEQELTSRYGELTSKMTVFFDGEEKTIQQMMAYLQNPDRAIREKAWKLILNRYAEDAQVLDELFDELKNLRVQIAKNAGFENYRDFVHKDKGRFSYSPEDLLKIHEVVEKVVVPFVSEFAKERAQKLGVETLKPWDFKVELDGELPKAFAGEKDFIEKGIATVAAVDPMFGIELERMWKNGFLDLENRKGKSPGAYCYPLYEQKSSFIFANSIGIRDDVRILVHEAGHSMHNLMSKGNAIYQYTNNPSEVSELASMSMELLSFGHWDNFYVSEFFGKIRKSELMEKIKSLPWGVVVDAFQHWIYTNPDHTSEERGKYFSELLDRFKIDGDWNGLEKEKAVRWMMQLHIFGTPFYYIEYVMAQSGAFGVYRNYVSDPRKTIEQYKDFLKLGYSKSVPEIYQTAGVPFDFSEKYVAELVEFLRAELEKEF